MTSIDDFQQDVQDISDTVLGDLDTEVLLQLFIKEVAEGRKERIGWLTETAPTKQYEATDLAYTDGMKIQFHVDVAKVRTSNALPGCHLTQTRPRQAHGAYDVE